MFQPQGFARPSEADGKDAILFLRVVDQRALSGYGPFPGFIEPWIERLDRRAFVRDRPTLGPVNRLTIDAQPVAHLCQTFLLQQRDGAIGAGRNVQVQIATLGQRQ